MLTLTTESVVSRVERAGNPVIRRSSGSLDGSRKGPAVFAQLVPLNGGEPITIDKAMTDRKLLGAAFGDLEGFLAPLAGHPGRGDAELAAKLFVFGFEEFEFGLRHGEGAVIGFFTGSDSGFQASDSGGYGYPAGLAPN